jgi:hypothetical protein
MGLSPLANACDLIGAFEVVLVLWFALPSPLSRPLALPPALRRAAIALTINRPGIRMIQLTTM